MYVPELFTDELLFIHDKFIFLGFSFLTPTIILPIHEVKNIGFGSELKHEEV